MSDPRIVNLLGALVLSIYDRMRDAIERESRMAGEAAAALVVIGNNSGRTVDWVSKTLRLSHSGTVRLIDKLVVKKLVSRRRSDNDSRALELSLTASGQRRMAALLRARSDVLDLVIGTLTSAEQDALRIPVERMLDALTVKELSDNMCRLCDEHVCSQDRCPITLACHKELPGNASVA